MIIVDTSVWIDHIRNEDKALTVLLDEEQVLLHPFVLGELSLGHVRDRSKRIAELTDLPAATVADPHEVLEMIERNGLAASGIGYVDAHLIASARLNGARVWTRDNRLALAARRLAVGETLH